MYANLRMAVPIAARQKRAVTRLKLDQVAVGGGAAHALDSATEYPGVTALEHGEPVIADEGDWVLWRGVLGRGWFSHETIHAH